MSVNEMQCNYLPHFPARASSSHAFTCVKKPLARIRVNEGLSLFVPPTSANKTHRRYSSIFFRASKDVLKFNVLTL